MADEPEPPAADGGGAARRRLRRAAWVQPAAIVAVAVYAILFVALNTRRVKVSFVFTSTRASVIWVILLSLAVGLVLGMLLSRLYRRRQRRR